MREKKGTFGGGKFRKKGYFSKMVPKRSRGPGKEPRREGKKENEKKNVFWTVWGGLSGELGGRRGVCLIGRYCSAREGDGSPELRRASSLVRDLGANGNPEPRKKKCNQEGSYPARDEVQ